MVLRDPVILEYFFLLKIWPILRPVESPDFLGEYLLAQERGLEGSSSCRAAYASQCPFSPFEYFGGTSIQEVNCEPGVNGTDILC